MIRHADAGAIAVTLDCEPGAPVMVLTFEDDGRAFNPLEQPAPPKPTSLEAAELGGLGLVMVRKAASRLDYERTADQKNRLTVSIAAS